MAEIVTSVQRVTDIMAEISAASQEQSAGIEQVNQTVMQMDETTQQNAALVEEATAAARSMEEQADALMAAVSVFKLDSTVRKPATRPASGTTSAVAPLPVARPTVPPAKPAAVKPAAKRPVIGAGRISAALKQPEPELVADAEWQEF
jgi:hypothetical protein